MLRGFEPHRQKSFEISERLVKSQHFKSLKIEAEYFWRSLCGEPRGTRRMQEIVDMVTELDNHLVDDPKKPGPKLTKTQIVQKLCNGYGGEQQGLTKYTDHDSINSREHDEATREISAAMANRVRPVIQVAT